MIRFSTLLLAAPLALAAQQPGGDGARPIALDEAVHQAQRNAPAAVTARNALRRPPPQRRRRTHSLRPVHPVALRVGLRLAAGW